MSPLTGTALALLSLVAWTAAAQLPAERTLRARRVPLAGTAVEVRVAPGVPTTLNFEADIHPPSVALDAPGRVKLLSVAARSITLTPVAELSEAVELRVRFADACAVLEPRFSLRADPAEVDAQVTAFRDARAPELLLARVAELEMRASACAAEVDTLRERGRASGPAALVLSGQLGAEGVRVANAFCDPGASGGWLTCEDALRFRAEMWVVVSMELRNLPGQPVWKPGSAWLASESSGERFAARVVALEPEALAPGAAGRLVVEFARPPRRPGEVYRVDVQEAEGTRHLSFRNMTMDDATPHAPKKDSP